jgi:hypothetical protein
MDAAGTSLLASLSSLFYGLTLQMNTNAANNATSTLCPAPLGSITPRSLPGTLSAFY